MPLMPAVPGMILASLEYRRRESTESLQRASALAPGSSEALSLMAVYAGAYGHIETAQGLMRRALEIDPLDPSAHLNWSRIQSWA